MRKQRKEREEVSTSERIPNHSAFCLWNKAIQAYKVEMLME
ncbi:MAG TPA: hypothetical protein VJZ04_00925 [Lachnospiraceae bacterium]|nr:hypothetical protein [Lachnospiraceae bacterium]